MHTHNRKLFTPRFVPRSIFSTTRHLLRLAFRRWLAAAAVAAGLQTPAWSQTWVNYTSVGTNWSVGGNWSTGIPPVSSAGTVLTFSSVPFTLPPTTTTFQTVGNYLSTNDNPTPFSFNKMIFDVFGSPDVVNSGATITSSVASGGLVLDGLNPSIAQNGTGSILFANGAAANDLVMLAGPTGGLSITGSGPGSVIFQGAINGGGPSTTFSINHTGTTPMFTGGLIRLDPLAGNGFVAKVALQAGNLSISNGTTPLGDTNNLLEISGGNLRAEFGAVTVANPISLVLAGNLTITGTNNLTFNGTVDGKNDIQVRTSTSTNQTFQNTINVTGSVVVEGQGEARPTLTLGSQSGTIHGTATLASAYTLAFGTMTLNNATFNATRLNPAAALNLFNGSLAITGNPSANTNESVSVTNLEGGINFTLTPHPLRAIDFVGGNYIADNNATFTVTTQGAGRTLGGPIGAPGNANLRFTSGISDANNINGVLPFGQAFITTGAGVNAATLVRYNGALGVIPLNLTTDYIQSSAKPLIGLNAPTQNYRLLSTKNVVEGINSPVQINALLLETPSGAGALGGGLFGNGVISLSSGVLGTSLVGGSVQPTYLGMTVQPSIALGPNAGYFHIDTNLTSIGPIVGSNGLVKNGPGTLTLLGDNSTLTGDLTINNGALEFTRDVNLGSPSTGIILGRGNGSGRLDFLPNTIYEASTTNHLATTRSLTLTGGGGGIAVGLINTTLEWGGTISGSGRLIKGLSSQYGSAQFGAGTLSLTGINNYTGDTVIAAGTLIVSQNANLGSPVSNVVLGSSANLSTLQIEGGSVFTTSRNVLLTSTASPGPSIFVSPTVLAIFNGNIGGNQPGTPWVKAGQGELILTAANSFNGAFTLGDAVATKRPGAPFAQPGGTLTLNGPEGAMAQATAYTLNLGTTLNLDNNFAVNPNRLSSSQITMNGAELKMTGNSSVTTFEHVGRGTGTTGLFANSLGNTITLIQPVSAGIRSTNLIATAYAVANTGIAFFRGTELGNTTPPNFTRVIFATAPTEGAGLTNGIMTGALYSDSPDGIPQDFARYLGSTNGVERFSAYTPLPTNGAVNTITYNHTGTLLMTAPQAANALKQQTSNINLNGNTLSITGAGMVLSVGFDTIFTSTGTPALAFGTQPARLTVNNNLAIGTAVFPVPVTTSAGLHKFGQGTLILAASTVTGGGYQISDGTLVMTTPAAYTSGQIVTLRPGATLDTGNLGTLATPFGTFPLTGFGTVNLGSGVLAIGQPDAGNRSFGGSFQGTGTLIHSTPSAGFTFLMGNSPGFNGDVRILSGNLLVDANVDPSDPTNPGPLGISTTPVQLGNTTGSANTQLRLGATVTAFHRNIRVPSGTTAGTVISLSTNGNSNITMNGNMALGRELRLLGPFQANSYIPSAVTINGIISDDAGNPGSLHFFSGNYNLHGANTYSGGTRIDAGPRNTLGIGHNSAFGTGPILIANTGFAASFRADNGPRVINNAFNFEAGTTPTTVGFVGQNNLMFTSPTVSLGGATRTFDVVSTGVTTFTGALIDGPTGTDVLAIIKNGGGRLRLNGASTFTGNFRLNGGTLIFGSSTTGGPFNVLSGPIGRGKFIVAGSAVAAAGGAQIIENEMDMITDMVIDGMNDITMGGQINIGGSTRRVTTTNTGRTTFSNTITENTFGPGPSGAIIKDGPGRLILSGNNSVPGAYTGGTTIEDGILRVNNTAGSGTGSGPVLVTAGTLEGTGSIAGSITVMSGGRIGGGESDGPSVGTLTHTGGTLTLNAGTVLVVGVTAGSTPAAPNTGGSSIGTFPNPTSNNYFNKTAGTVTFNLGALLVVDITGTTFNSPFLPYSYQIAKFAGNDLSGVTLPDSAVTFIGGTIVPGTASVQGDANGVLFLNFTPTPEPTALLAIAGVALGALRLRRRSRSA